MAFNVEATYTGLREGNFREGLIDLLGTEGPRLVPQVGVGPEV